MAITYTQADLDSLNEALLTGAEEVVIGERKIKYRSKADLLSLIKMIQEKLDDVANSSKSTSLVQATFKKGYTE